MSTAPKRTGTDRERASRTSTDHLSSVAATEEVFPVGWGVSLARDGRTSDEDNKTFAT